MRGIIIDEPRGRGGFGYDPVFSRSGAEQDPRPMSPGKKNARSHRRKALDALKTRLQESGLLHD
jgi:XTP/dITP diphosphohydrolase